MKAEPAKITRRGPARGSGRSWRLDWSSVALLVGLASSLGVVPTPRILAQHTGDSQDVVPHGQERTPNPPLSPSEAVQKMSVPPGFRVEIVASEPDIVNPVAMTFDDRGRIWITESLEYPRAEGGPGRDRVKILEDTDGDGAADRFTVFAEGLNIPSGIAVGHGGVWVANAPDLLFFQDLDGDDRADTREVVVTGFGRHDTHELPNSLTWGPDGWLYGWNGVFNPSKVQSRDGTTYEFTCAIFRIHPRTKDFQIFCEGTSNPWGLAIDPEGSFFASACVIDHLWHLVESGYYIRQGGPYPPHTWPIGSIVDHVHQKAAYCGIHYFDSPAYPPAYRGRLYMGNIHGNCINVDVLHRNGSTYRATAEADFLTANDAWFMPVAQKTGPDGCLYILDWYDRYHCYQDAMRDPQGIDRLKGRLYRVRYGETPRRVGFNLASVSLDELLGLLDSPNVYDRDCAQRLLAERGGKAVHDRLTQLCLDRKAPRRARMHALWAMLGGGEPPTPETLLGLMSDPDPAFRAWGIRAAGNVAATDPQVRQRLIMLARDQAPEVVLQAAIAAPKLPEFDPIPILLDALLSAPSDPLIPQIVWQNLHPRLDEAGASVLSRIESIRQGATDAAIRPLLPRLMDRLLASPRPPVRDLAAWLKLVLLEDDDPTFRQCADLLEQRLREGSLPDSVVSQLQHELEALMAELPAPVRERSHGGEIQILRAYCGDPQALVAVCALSCNPEAPEELRLRAIRASLLLDRSTAPLELIRSILDANPPLQAGMRGRVLEILAESNRPQIADLVLEVYPRLETEDRRRAIDLLTQRPAWAKALLRAVGAGKIENSALNLNQLRRLKRSPDREIVLEVERIWGRIREERNPQRERVVSEIRELVRRTPGDPFAGQAVFQKLCASCHRIYGEGQDVGPDLTLNGRNDFEQLLSNIFDPSLVIGPAYQATIVATDEGRVVAGLLVESTAERVVLKLQGGQLETIPRQSVEEIKLSPASLMPEDVEQQLSEQEIVDLVAFLSLDRPPGDPAAKKLPGSGPLATSSTSR